MKCIVKGLAYRFKISNIDTITMISNQFSLTWRMVVFSVELTNLHAYYYFLVQSIVKINSLLLWSLFHVVRKYSWSKITLASNACNMNITHSCACNKNITHSCFMYITNLVMIKTRVHDIFFLHLEYNHDQSYLQILISIL